MVETFTISSATESAEILLVMIVSLIGASIHEYIFRSNTSAETGFLRNPKVWISGLVSSIICYAIDPWILEINPRLVLLPPLLLGLAGMDLVLRLSTLRGVSVFFEWILGFFQVTNAKNEDGGNGIPGDDGEILHDEVEGRERHEQQQPIEPEIVVEESPNSISSTANAQATIDGPVLPTAMFEKLMNLDQMVHSVLDSICNLVVMYYIGHDAEQFLRGYYTIKTNISIMQHTIKEYQLIPISTAIKLSEILKKETELDSVHKEVIEILKNRNRQENSDEATASTSK